MQIIPRHYSNAFVVDKDTKDKDLKDYLSKVHLSPDDYGESNTDKSFYRPDVSAVRSRLGTGSASGRTPLYDYPDGVDKGDNIMVILRTKGLDPTELDAFEARLEQDVELKKQLDDEKQLAELKSKSNDEMKEWIRTISEKFTDSSESSESK